MSKQHYYLMAGQIRYEIKGNSLSVNLNTLLQNDEQFVNMKDIGQTQQAMQIRFFREILPPSPDVVVKDVFIQSVSYLGYMTPEEFNAQPEPMTSDTPEEDKPAQNIVEGVSTSSETIPLEPLDIPSTNAPMPAGGYFMGENPHDPDDQNKQQDHQE